MILPMSSKISQLPNLRVETELFESGNQFVIGMDEVGRGSIAGPVAVGVALLDLTTCSSGWPLKLRDSKLISEKTRAEIFLELGDWVSGWSVGMASVSEIEQEGILASLALAGARALEQLLEDASLRAKVANHGVTIILDGSHNWLGAKSMGIPVMVKTKADRDCVSVAAASVLAKVTRDRFMVELSQSHIGYGLDSNKGYASASHIDAIRELGISPIHRVSWLSRIIKG